MFNFANVFNGAKPLLALEFAKTLNKIIICKDAQEIERLTLQLKFFGYQSNQIITLYSQDNRPYEPISSSSIIKNSRIIALNDILNLTALNANHNTFEGKIIITTLRAICQKFGALEEMMKDSFTLSVSEEVEMHSIIQHLSTLGFTKNGTALEFGEYAVRGSILDIACNSEFGYRVDFFGNRIESIRQYCFSTQRSSEHVEEIMVLPINELILNKERIDTFCANFKQIGEIIYDAVKSGIYYAGIENYLPYFYNQPLKTPFDYLHEGGVLLIDQEVVEGYQEWFQKLFDQYQNRKSYSDDNRTAPPLPPEDLFLEPGEVEKFLSRVNTRFHSTFYAEGSKKLAHMGKKFYQHALAIKKDYLNIFKEYLQNSSKNDDELCILCCFNEIALEHAARILQKADLHPTRIENLHEIDNKNPCKLFITIYPIDDGFKTSGVLGIKKNLLFISEPDLFGKHLSSKQRRKRSTSTKDALNYLNEIKCGELIVHKEHGIGRFDEIKTMEIAGKIHDFISLTYANDDKIYLPVENLDLISKYSEGEVNIKELDKLGALNWQKRKVRLKERIKMHATQLVANAAARASKSGMIFEVEEDAYTKFCDGFKFIETEDQARAIEDTIADLKSGTPMDRLVCGDVGFGKTEIALRAACAVALNNTGIAAQVMVVVPTTLLARQHYQNFISRFEDLSVRIAQLSKFTQRNQVKIIKQDFRDGKIDIIIGTHALLASDVAHKNLGLIIIDEEQHFGVKQKERLKELKSNVHILTLSATPIPRTLHLSLNGVKSLSLIASPPTERIPVKTFVMPFDTITARDAIVKEKLRGGRTFIVTPRVKYIPQIESEMRHILDGTGVNITSAHGGLSSTQLDGVMNDFYDGKYDVLISTSIIESGIDIPTANTIIIDRAQLFGLAQGYQLRGRVGRSNIGSYAYFTYPKGAALTENARKRLSIIQSLEDLGGGFHIASHDMEIRGYGNLLGEEQSGNIKEVGMELYQDMLAEAIAQLKSSDSSSGTSSDSEAISGTDQDWSPNLNIGISIQIPSEYISDSNLKLSFYRKIAKIDSKQEHDDLYSEMIDRFGVVPQEVDHLFDIIELKKMCKDLNIEKLDANSSYILVKFRNNTPKDRDKILEFIDQNPGKVSLQADMRVKIESEIPGDADQKSKHILEMLENFSI